MERSRQAQNKLGLTLEVLVLRSGDGRFEMFHNSSSPLIAGLGAPRFYPGRTTKFTNLLGT